MMAKCFGALPPLKTKFLSLVSRRHWISRGNRRQGAIQGISLCTFYALRAKARARERKRPKCRGGREAYEKPSFGGSFA